jgi:citrate synthase
MAVASSSGLEGIVAADTAISDVDGERGRLVIAGRDVEALALETTFEGAAARVWAAGAAETLIAGSTMGDGARPAPVSSPSAPMEARSLRGPAMSSLDLDSLGRARQAAWELLPRLGDALDAADGMEALRASLAHVRSTGDDTADALTVLGAAPVFVAAWSRMRRGLPPVAPSTEMSHAADYLRMTLGAPSSDSAARALDAYLVTVIDHGMNASTFTARVVTSTGSDLVSAVVAAVGALKGPLHGGAPGPVLDMVDAVGDPSRAEAWLLAELAAGRRIMGMGHRIYRVRDPRAAVLEAAVNRTLGSLASARLEMARAVETAAAKILRERKPDRPLAANVEFYTAVLLDAVGLPREQFSPTFAVGRIAGWCAHVFEQRRTGKLIRPASRYVGAI